MGDPTLMKDEYRYHSTQVDHTAGYLWSPVFSTISALPDIAAGCRVLDVGCGNGAFTAELLHRGFVPTGIDASESGIRYAKEKYPEVDFFIASAYDDLASNLGRFTLVTSLEVVEHLYSPREYARRILDALEPGGYLILSTPFHGYWKNLSLVLSGSFDKHFSPLWDHGHIKFWSPTTLKQLLQESGFQDVAFTFAGRFYPFSKSMVAVARKPTIII